MHKVKTIITSFIIGFNCLAYGASCSDHATYRDICQKAAVNSWVFQNFRSLPAYIGIVELGGGQEFVSHILKNGSEQTLKKLDEFQELDKIGNPSRTKFVNFGIFSGTTLRYITIADHIKSIFQLPQTPKIVEIGAGFGGQCYILSRVQGFSKYYIYDLPEVSALINKVVDTLNVKNVSYLSLDQSVPEKEIDLVISNYAFSECDRKTQLDYFERIIKKSKRGYMIYNQISSRFDIDSLSPNEFFDLLKQQKLHPKIEDEPVCTYPGNVLITWDAGRGHS